MNKKVYYPSYTINPESIYGSGIVKPNSNPNVNTTTSVITGSFPVKKKLSPPMYRTGLSIKPQDTNGYRVLENKNDDSYKLDKFYYTSQQTNKNIIPDMSPSLKDKLKNKIKNVATEIINKPITKNINTKKSKQKNDIDESTDELVDYIGDEIKQNMDRTNNLDKYGRNKKMWIDDHYLYSLEPRYNSVIYPWRAYTWMYPVTPNSDNYYIDNINSSPVDPIIITNDTTNKGNYQASYLASNLKENFENDELPNYDEVQEKYKQNKCFQNYNILYFIIIVFILSIYFNK